MLKGSWIYPLLRHPAINGHTRTHVHNTLLPALCTGCFTYFIAPYWQWTRISCAISPRSMRPDGTLWRGVISEDLNRSNLPFYDVLHMIDLWSVVTLHWSTRRRDNLASFWSCICMLLTDKWWTWWTFLYRTVYQVCWPLVNYRRRKTEKSSRRRRRRRQKTPNIFSLKLNK